MPRPQRPDRLAGAGGWIEPVAITDDALRPALKLLGIKPTDPDAPRTRDAIRHLVGSYVAERKRERAHPSPGPAAVRDSCATIHAAAGVFLDLLGDLDPRTRVAIACALQDPAGGEPPRLADVQRDLRLLQRAASVAKLRAGEAARDSLGHKGDHVRAGFLFRLSELFRLNWRVDIEKDPAKLRAAFVREVCKALPRSAKLDLPRTARPLLDLLRPFPLPLLPE